MTEEHLIDFEAAVLDMDDAPILVDGSTAPMRIGEVCVNALMASVPDDKSDGVEKLKRYNLARKIKGSADEEAYPAVSLNSKQKTLVLSQSELIWSALIYSRIHEALEGSTEEDKE